MAAIPFRLPPDDQLPDRVGAVCAVVYLIFNEGYDATRGEELLRVDLAAEAIRLGRLLGELAPDDPEVAGLLALLVLHHARADARVDPHGDLVPLEEQDRGRWDANMIGEGLGLLDRALRRQRPGPYQLQAAIAAQHALAARAADTDWLQIAALYAELLRLRPSPTYELNRAVAVAMAYGPDAGLALLDRLDATGALAGYHLLAATRADLERRAGPPTGWLLVAIRRVRGSDRCRPPLHGPERCRRSLHGSAALRRWHRHQAIAAHRPSVGAKNAGKNRVDL
jgi:RNA polymerase sigma-70 factor (ECF subfamily)